MHDSLNTNGDLSQYGFLNGRTQRLALSGLSKHDVHVEHTGEGLSMHAVMSCDDQGAQMYSLQLSLYEHIDGRDVFISHLYPWTAIQGLRNARREWHKLVAAHFGPVLARMPQQVYHDPVRRKRALGYTTSCGTVILRKAGAMVVPSKHLVGRDGRTLTLRAPSHETCTAFAGFHVYDVE